MKGVNRRVMLVCIDSYENGVPKGHIHNVSKSESESFMSLTQLLSKMEKQLDDEKFPQAFDRIRGFGENKIITCQNENEENEKCGALATFAIRILFRQNASWQGDITWIEGGYEESFRSVLEMILLMNSALTSESVSV